MDSTVSYFVKKLELLSVRVNSYKKPGVIVQRDAGRRHNTFFGLEGTMISRQLHEQTHGKPDSPFCRKGSGIVVTQTGVRSTFSDSTSSKGQPRKSPGADVALADQSAGVVDGLGKAKLEDLEAEGRRLISLLPS